MPGTPPVNASTSFDSGLARLRELPGVESAAVGLSLPYERPLNDGFRRMDGPEASDQDIITDLCYVTPEYFQTLRIPLLTGRVFRRTDGPSSAPVVIVNQAFVKKYLSKQEAVGSHLLMGSAGREIVGVTGDVQQKRDWGGFEPFRPTPTAYIPVSQTSDRFLTLVHTWFSPSWVVRERISAEHHTSIQSSALKSIPSFPSPPFTPFKTSAQRRSDRSDSRPRS